jgi:Domain of unknown function (DUF4157)
MYTNDQERINNTTQPAALQRKGDEGMSIQPPPFRVTADAVQRKVDMPVIQTKMTLGAPDNMYEREADNTADKVVSQINAPESMQKKEEASIQRMGGGAEEEEPLQAKAESIQRMGGGEEEEPLQAKSIQRSGGEGAGEVGDDISSNINNARGGGSSMPETVQSQMGDAMGADFSGVRIHNNSNADTLNRSMNARAFTTGPDIFFKQGEYNPGSQGGQKLLAHELTHVVQQGASGVQKKKED